MRSILTHSECRKREFEPNELLVMPYSTPLFSSSLETEDISAPNGPLISAVGPAFLLSSLFSGRSICFGY